DLLFFQAEGGIRDFHVTGVQTCALPISGAGGQRRAVLMKRVVVTGMAGITSLGSDWAGIEANFSANRSGIRHMDEWARFTELNTRLGGPVDDFVVPAHWTRKQLRSMGRVSRLSVGAAEQALAHAGLLDDGSIRDGRMGVACGSSTGSTEEDRKSVVEGEGGE